MNLTALEQTVLAYFLTVEGPKVSIDGRFYLRDNFDQIFLDRIFFSAQSLVGGREQQHSKVAGWLVDKLIESGALSTARDTLGGTSHQFIPAKYKAAIKELAESNAICQLAQQGGPQFWQETFAKLGKP
jgi:hypothetical protein